MMLQKKKGLKFLLGYNVVHRDMKLNNITIRVEHKNGKTKRTAVIIDLGCAVKIDNQGIAQN